jgi:nucleotide-binding universal stress UspA family protein
MIKDLVVNLAVGGARDVAGDYALALAKMFEAHLAGVAFAYDPVVAATAAGGVPVNFVDAQRLENETAAKASVTRFEQAAKAAGLSVETQMLDATFAGAAELFGRVARRFDLAVVGQVEPERAGAAELIIEASLFESGRPVVVVPYIQKGLQLERVLACWDGSRTAARAIADAIPILSRAQSVELLFIANERGKRDENPGEHMIRHLARHGITATAKQLAAGDSDIASTILSYAADGAADLIIMGGYGHSRLREFILGGATRGILNTMTVPVLMSH